jgi:hypothetical protein
MIGLQHLAQKLGGEVRRRQVLCPGPGHSPADRSLAVKPSGDRLLVHSYAGNNPIACLQYVRDKLGALGAPSCVQAVAKGDPEYDRRQHEKAQWLWHQRKPISGTIAERYLRQARGYGGPLPATLGFLAPRKPEHHPAMIATFGLADESEPGVLRAPREAGAIHLTLLRPDSSGKANVERPKLIIGSPGHLPIVLAPPNDLLGLAIVEGIETGLSVYAATGLGVWAAASASRMPALADVLPSYVECATIYQEGDPAGRRGAQELAQKLVKRGVEVLIAEASP